MHLGFPTSTQEKCVLKPRLSQCARKHGDRHSMFLKWSQSPPASQLSLPVRLWRGREAAPHGSIESALLVLSPPASVGSSKSASSSQLSVVSTSYYASAVTLSCDKHTGTPHDAMSFEHGINGYPSSCDHFLPMCHSVYLQLKTERGTWPSTFLLMTGNSAALCCAAGTFCKHN